jgi:hypothetical protein
MSTPPGSLFRRIKRIMQEPEPGISAEKQKQVPKAREPTLIISPAKYPARTQISCRHEKQDRTSPPAERFEDRERL